MVSIEQAAVILNVSVEHVFQLIRKGEFAALVERDGLPIRSDDLVEFKRKDKAYRRMIARKLTADAQENDLGY